MRLLYALFLIAFCLPAAAQTGLQGNILKGTVLDAKTHLPINAVTVLNNATQAVAYTDAEGFFTITARPGDELVFSFIGYNSYLTKTEAVIDREDLRVYLRPKDYTLGEVIIRPKYTPYQADSIERHSEFQRPLVREHGGSIMSPVTFLAEKISKNSRRIFAFQKDFARMEKERFTDSRYTAELTQQMTGLAGDTLAFFMNAYPMPYDYSRAASDLELKVWIRDNFKDWVAKGRPVPNIAVDSTLQKTMADSTAAH